MGKESFEILEENIYTNSKGEKLDLNKVKGYTIQYGTIVDSKTDEKIDEVLVSFFRDPKSYTREDMCEINSHGGMIVEKQILEQCLKEWSYISRTWGIH